MCVCVWVGGGGEDETGQKVSPKTGFNQYGRNSNDTPTNYIASKMWLFYIDMRERESERERRRER